VLSIVSASAQQSTLASPKQYPEWFLQPKDLGALSWDDSFGNGEGGLFIGGGYVYVFHTSLSDKELISRVEAWAHAQHYELVERTADTKLVAAEFDVDKDPAGAGKRALARGHTRVVSVETEGEHKVGMTLTNGALR